MISVYSVKDVQPVKSEEVKRLSDKDIILEYIQKVRLAPHHITSVKEYEDKYSEYSSEIYNRGLYSVEYILYKRIVKERAFGISVEETFNQKHDFYFKNTNSIISKKQKVELAQPF